MKTLMKLFILIFFPFTLYSQSTGKIAGKVVDVNTGEPIVGANVIVEGTNYGAATDIEGDYAIVKVPSGIYNIIASYIGYTKTIIKNVQVFTDLTTEVNFKLNPSAVTLEKEIVVVAQTPMIKKDLTATESRVTSEEIRQLPLQDLTRLISLQAGVSRDQSGGIHIRGGRSSEISYLLNGISITDDFSRTQALAVETESVQELQVISGSFNAEYGNAMSGIVNIITKTGGSKFQSNFEVWTGDYLSNHKDIFWNIDKINPFSNYNFQGSAGGPILKDKLRYFISLRRFHNGGYIYGINKYNPQGRYKLVEGQLLPNPGDSSFVSMNWNDRWSGQGTVDWNISEKFKLKIDAFGSIDNSKFYNHLYRLNPYGDASGINRGYSIFANLTHLIYTNTFQELTFAYKFNEFISRLYDDPYDLRYVHPDSMNVPGYHFLRAGTNLNRFQRNTKSFILKWSFTSQIDKINLAKLGVEFQFDNLFYENIILTPEILPNGQQVIPFRPYIQGIESPQHDRFERYPFKFSAFIQDKIEFESLIINLGLRFDLFNPNGKIPIDESDPNIFNPFKLEHIYKDLNNDGKIGLDEQKEENKFTLAERESFWYKKASLKSQLSPRVGIAYPITDKGIIRFSYGIFQQIPEYSQLYLRDQYKLTSAQGTQGPFGNNDLKPQRTTIYELGLQQQFFDDFALDITAFYRDIRDWISSSQPIPTFLAGISYSKRINRDFANVRGITLAVNKRFTNNYSFGVDYTFQIAEGTNSSPDQEFYSQLNGAEPTKVLSPLDWDQTHTFNANLYVGDVDWGISLIFNFYTGQPYTPTYVAGAYAGRNVLSGLAQNSRRKPSITRLDLELHKNFSFSFLDIQLFLKIFNLFDAKNPLLVFGDTGKPDFTIEELQVKDYDPGWFDYPNFYSEPRNIYLGTKIYLK